MTLKLKLIQSVLLCLSLFPLIGLSSGCSEATKQTSSLSSTISYSLSEKDTITITLYDVFGNKIYTKDYTETVEGQNTITLTNSEIATTSISNSIYFYIIKDSSGTVLKEGKTVFN